MHSENKLYQRTMKLKLGYGDMHEYAHVTSMVNEPRLPHFHCPLFLVKFTCSVCENVSLIMGMICQTGMYHLTLTLLNFPQVFVSFVTDETKMYYSLQINYTKFPLIVLDCNENFQILIRNYF
jgi:hypothetical protein